MTVDVNLKKIDDYFIEEIDEIMEDTMVQLFVTHPQSEDEIARVQEHANDLDALFYTVPLKLRNLADANCVGYSVTCNDNLDAESDKPLFIDEAELTCKEKLQKHRGIILNATQPHDDLEHFFISIGPATIDVFDNDALNQLSMDTLVLQSDYPAHGFEMMFQTAKKISDAMFRPEQSIIARATKSTLVLLGFKKG